MPREFDVIVRGGGPAGAAAARRLAELGHRVALVHKQRGGPLSGPRWETISPNTAELLRHSLSTSFPQIQDLLRPCRATVRWTREHQDSFFVQPAMLVERQALDALLRRLAVNAGVMLLESEPSASDSATFVIDATGRLSGGRDARSQHGPRTLALTATIGGSSLGQWETRVEALDEGWFWAVRTNQATASVTLFVSPDALAGWRGRNWRETLRQTLEKSSLRDDAALEVISGVRGVEATVTTRHPFPEEALMRIGDAALAQDPLASQGLHYALLSAQQASAAVHTCARAGDVVLARSFIEARHEEILTHHVRTCAEIYRQQDVFTSSFWESRRGVSSTELPAFKASPLRQGYADKIALSPQLRWETTAVLQGDLIVPCTALSHQNLSRPMAFLAGYPVTELLMDLPATLTVGMLVRHWLARGLSPENASRALTFLQQHEVVIAAG